MLTLGGRHFHAQKAPDALAAYRAAIEKDFQKGNATEHTYRPALKTLIEALATGVDAMNEPRQVECGAPDFTILKRQLRLGNIECKTIGTPLDEELKTDQLKRYLKALPNLILTDYLEFRWFVRGEHRLASRLASVVGKKLREQTDGPQEVARLLAAFLREEVPTISSPRELAERMASLAQLIRHAITRALAKEEEGGTLHEQLKGFRKVLLHDLDNARFADMYAQTICYGLFAARCNHRAGQPFTRQVAAYDLPKTNPFLRRMFSHIAGPDLDSRVVWAVDDLVDLLNRTQINLILKDFGTRTRQQDPVVHFYETFLAAYDPKMREARGVYYTPEPVVSYIVRSVDHILKTEFGLPDGLADASNVKLPQPKGSKQQSGEVHKVLILDPAAGTGTFLHGVIDEIYAHQVEKGQKGAWSKYVSQHLLPRLFGFELLMAPYAVAHMKLGLQLEELGYKFEENERLRVYLTNTLEEAHEMSGLPLFAQWLSDEANAASEVKERVPVMVVLGNPPYSGHSANKGLWIKGLLKGRDTRTGEVTSNYFEADGRPLGEIQVKWLHDDYVKFFRFAQWRIEQTGYGVLAFISNSGYLDNPTFRGMRQSLLKDFDEIYLLDLHGSSKKRELSPDGSKDENVFDIQQGVAIGIFIKRSRGGKKIGKVLHADVWGPRESYRDEPDGESTQGGKYKWLRENDIRTISWKRLQPTSPGYILRPKESELSTEWETGTAMRAIMPTNSVGVVTARDKLTVHMDAKSVLDTVLDFSALQPEEARSRYALGPDARDWKVEEAQNDVLRHGVSESHVAPLLYRPFDLRFTYYTGISRGFIGQPQQRVMGQMLDRRNLGFATSRSIEIGRGWEHVFCTRHMIQHHTVSLKEVNYLFPLYLYSGSGDRRLFDEHRPAREPNFSRSFTDQCQRLLGMQFIHEGTGEPSKSFGPEDIFHYIYAILHSPSYRSRYAEFLKSDFPRIPLTRDREQFRKLCDLGRGLVSMHLLESPKLANVITSYTIAGSDEVGKGFPKYLSSGSAEPGTGRPLVAGRVYINSTSAAKLDGQYFDNVPPEIWEFHIGGYQVCEKWLKDRRGRTLTHDDIMHYQKVVTALAETIRLMGEIDAAIPKWPIE